jgi:aconitate hydratase
MEPGTTWQSLGLRGDEQVSIRGIGDLKPRQIATLEIRYGDGRRADVPALVRIDTLDELEYFRHGGILQYVLRSLVKQAA